MQKFGYSPLTGRVNQTDLAAMTDDAQGPGFKAHDVPVLLLGTLGHCYKITIIKN